MSSPHHLTIPCVQSPFCTWRMNLPCSFVSPNSHKAFVHFRKFNEGLERQQSIHESEASYFKAACGTSPSACPQSYSVIRVLPLPASSFFCSTTPVSNSSLAPTGQFNFLSCFLVSSLPPGSHCFHPDSLSKFFPTHFQPIRGILVSTVKLFYQPVLQVVSLTWTSLTMPPVFLKILFPLNMPNPQVWSSALCPPLSLPETLVTSFTFRANSAGFL